MGPAWLNFRCIEFFPTSGPSFCWSGRWPRWPKVRDLVGGHSAVAERSNSTGLPAVPTLCRAVETFGSQRERAVYASGRCEFGEDFGSLELKNEHSIPWSWVKECSICFASYLTARQTETDFLPQFPFPNLVLLWAGGIHEPKQRKARGEAQVQSPPAKQRPGSAF